MAIVAIVEMGEIRVERASGTRLQACGLGACVGLCLFESFGQAAVLVHVVLPQTLPPVVGRPAVHPMPGKCADTALQYALTELGVSGAETQRVRAALVGGAQIFTPAAVSGTESAALSRLEIGQRNVRALKDELARFGITLDAEETGGHGGRTVTLEAGTGNVWVRPVGMPERLLVSLGQSLASSALPAASAAAQPARDKAICYGN